MADASNSVVHLTMRFNKEVLSIGTGVVYQFRQDFYIITAWHNLSGLHSETLKPLSNKASIPNNIIANIAVSVPNGMAFRQSITLPLYDEEKSLYFIHSENWPRIDVAVIPFDPDFAYLSERVLSTGEPFETTQSLITQVHGIGKTEICPIQKYLVPVPKIIKEWLDSVKVTQEVFIPGYPHNIQDYYAQPIWKRATIASSVQLGWNRQSKFLIDSASKAGMSGSPVIHYCRNGQVEINGTIHTYNNDVSILVGIYVGRIGIDGDSDPQIGTVWHKSVIDEIIRAECFENHPHNLQLPMQDLMTQMNEILKTCSKEGIENICNPNLPSRHYVRDTLLKKINGRASPENALEAVINAAKIYNGPLVQTNE